jgi:hypothetical protein
MKQGTFAEYLKKVGIIVEDMENAPTIARDILYDLWSQGMEADIAVEILCDLVY